MACMKAKHRRFRFYYLAGMPAEICGGGEDLTAVQAAAKVMEEYTDQREAVLRALTVEHNVGCARRGGVYKGQQFLIVCVK